MYLNIIISITTLHRVSDTKNVYRKETMKKIAKMKNSKYTLIYLESLPTIARGQADDLKIESPLSRVWLSRMTVDDGMEYNNQVTEETLYAPKYINGQWTGSEWKTKRTYQAA